MEVISPPEVSTLHNGSGAQMGTEEKSFLCTYNSEPRFPPEGLGYCSVLFLESYQVNIFF